VKLIAFQQGYMYAAFGKLVRGGAAGNAATDHNYFGSSQRYAPVKNTKWPVESPSQVIITGHFQAG
jgi:hypothetical protein